MVIIILIGIAVAVARAGLVEWIGEDTK